MTYARAVGFKTVIVILTMSMVHELAEMYLDVWLSKWTQDHTNGTANETQRNRRLGIYGAIGLFRGNSNIRNMFFRINSTIYYYMCY